jgi:hypothetical protein
MIVAIPFLVLCALSEDSFVYSDNQTARPRDVVVIWPENPAPEDCFPQRTHEIVVRDKAIEFKTPLPRGYHVWFAEGLARVFVNGRCGFVDQKHRIVIWPTFDNAENFSEGLAVILQNGKYGYIDTEGHVVVAPEYQWAYWFKHGLGSVKKDGKYGLIDRTGKWVLKPTYDGQLDPTDDGFNASYLGGVVEHLDKTGKIIRDAPHGKR